MYYMLAPGGEYYNYSGCGNTLNCNQPVVRQFILDCLRYWVTEYHVDGFRWDRGPEQVQGGQYTTYRTCAAVRKPFSPHAHA